MSEQKITCAELEDQLAALIDGDEATLARFADHLAECDRCRDLKHDAELAAELVPHAGADFRLPDDLEQRVLAAIDERGDGELRPTVQTSTADADSAPPASGRSEVEVAAPSTGSTSAPGGSAPSKAIYFVMAAAAVLLVAIGAVGYLVSQSSEGDPGPDEQVAEEHLSPADDATGATIIQIVRAAMDGQTGVTARPAGMSEFSEASVDNELGPGSAIRTDERTRAQLRLSDGSTLVLNHNTEVTLDAQAPRRIHLAAGGEVLAEVTHLESAPAAELHTPSGRVEVLGTKLLVTATAEVTTVRVTRGAVRVHGTSGQQAEVKAGEEGLLPTDGAPTVSPAINLAGSVAWSEMSDGGEEVERSMTGLGELRARRPGEREESERPLNMTKHKVRVRIVGNVARTEVEEVFRNDSNVTLEGIYSFPMPPDARIAKLALEVDGQLEEGAFVERDLASKIWRGVIRRATPQQQRQQQEEFIWVPGPWRDPALLEWQQGGQFQLRIFPIKAHSQRRVVLAYEQTVQPHGDSRRYVYPMPHSADASTRVGQFELDLRVAGADPAHPVKAHHYEVQRSQESGGATRLAMTRSNFLPAGDLVVDYRLAGGNREMRWWTYQGPAAAAPTVEARPGSRRGSAPEVVAAQKALANDSRPYVVFSIRPELPVRTESQPRDYILVVDSSQSMVGERFARTTQLVTGVVAEMDRRDRFTVLACDATCQSKPGGPRPPSSEAAGEVQQWLSTLRPAGASDLLAAMNEAARVAGQSPSDRDVRVIYFGDGVATVGHRQAGPIRAEVDRLTQSRELSFTTVGVGVDSDAMVLSAIARSGGGHYIPFVPGQRTSAVALRVLETTYGVSLRDPRIEWPAGVTEVAPASLPTLRAGEEVVVAARFDGEVRGEVVLRGTVGGQPYVDRYPIHLTPSTSAGNAFVPRVWAAQTINELQLSGRGDDRHRIVALSRGFGVMSRHTSLLVLESEAMFRAFRVDRSRPSIDWTGEEEMDGNESDGQEQHAGPSVMTATRRSSRSTGAGGGGVRRRRARQAPARAPAASEAAPMAEPRRGLDGLSGGGMAAPNLSQDRSAAREQAPQGRGRGRWMRRVWERSGAVHANAAVLPRHQQAVAEAEEALRQQPDSRDRHRDLFRALARAGNLERAEQIAEQWLTRDQLDPEALIALSDVVGRQGRRDEALRLLTGVVDLEPDSSELQERLAEAFERAGKPLRACRHRVALAEADGAEVDEIVAALRCERSLSHQGSANQLLDSLSDSRLRTRVERAASRSPRTRGVHGDVMLEATWSGSQDLDLTLVNSHGQRISWMGGRSNVVGESATTPGRERLGLRWTPVGTYYIEVSRTDPADTTPVSGQVSVRALGSRRNLDFSLTGAQTTVGRLRVRRQSRLVPF